MFARQLNDFCLLARWTARVVSLLLVLMVLTILIGEGLPRLAGLTGTQLAQFAAFAVVLAGLLAAWRWELAGATAALLGLAAFEGLEFSARGGFAHGAFPWFAIPALLYLLANLLGRTPVASRPRGH
jgi:hypothetical protein